MYPRGFLRCDEAERAILMKKIGAQRPVGIGGRIVEGLFGSCQSGVS